MGNLPINAFDATVVLGALCLYALIWYASRSLSRFAQVLARLMPLMLVIPVLLLMQVLRAPLTAGKAPTDVISQAQVPSAPEAARTPASEPGLPAATPPTERPTEVAPPVPPTETAPEPGRQARAAAPPAEPAAAAAPPTAPPQEPKREADAEPPPAAAQAPPAEAERTARRAEPPMASDDPAKPAEAKPAAAAAPDAPTGGPRPGEAALREADWDVVPVFYGTDRQRADGAQLRYTSDRGHRLDLGRALVTVPRSHQVPNIERPFAIRVPYLQITVLAPAEDPKLHFTIKELTALTREQFVAMARERSLGGHAFKDQAIVFVHGTNTEFDTALYRSAQMAYDLKFDGATFLYSWPSAGTMTGYVYDRDSSEQAEPYLREFLDMVLRETEAKSVSVIAHSMGNLPLLRVLQVLGPQLPADVRLNQIILAAPDIDRDVFANLASTIRPYGRGVTLYCSSNDRAMAAARRAAGGIPRAGDVSADGPVVLAGIDTIDISQTSTEYLALNHSSYAETSALLNDIGKLLRTGARPPEARTPILQRIATPSGDFWRYPAVP